MRFAVVLILLVIAAQGVSGSAREPAGPARGLPERVEFNRDIRPILSDKCFVCHGFDEKKRKAGLRLDVAEGALAGGRSGEPAVKPGDLAGSTLWQRITTTDEDDLMPPAESNKEITPEQRDLLRRWIEQGALYQRHWSFELPVLHAPPRVSGGNARNPIDRFILDRLAREGLAGSPEASREILIRRVTFDLTGLPPTPEEVDAFLSDEDSGAYERLVDRLLGSPRFGEEMARHWLDLARYADTHGLHLDNQRSMWPYRDWVVKAFNSNLPFDEFTIQQLAGDLLPNPGYDALIATGFNRNNVTTSEGGAIDEEFIFRYAVDRASTTAETWMGLTAGCAVCHDHKFDPISTKEFYSLYAFFHSAADPAMDGNIALTKPFLRLKSEEDEKRFTQFDADITNAQVRITAAIATYPYRDPATQEPRPPARDVEDYWLDDHVPGGWRISASPGALTEFVTASEGSVRPFSGERAVRRKDAGLAQDVVETDKARFEVGSNARLIAHVYLDPADPPRTIMLQYKTGEWRHRAVWGDHAAIPWGREGTTEKVDMGPLPKAGAWVALEIEASTLGLKVGDKIDGFALTQFGGTVYWDKIGMSGRIDPASDPTRSFLVWSRQYDDGKELPREIREILKDTPWDQRSDAQTAMVRDYYISRICAESRTVFDPLLAVESGLKKEKEEFESAIPATLVWRDLEKPRESFVMMRGAYDRPGERVMPNVPAFLPPLPCTNTPTRLDLARWLLDPAHPLTARVAANRVWQQFFGTGLVKTSGDFGSQGEPPSHPGLLDWLAITYRESGWDTKGLVRLIVTSGTYRQSSRVAPDAYQRDPENRLLARGPRLRLDAEEIRDNALFVSGLLVNTMGGRGVKTYQPPNIWEPVGFVGSDTREYRQDSGAALYRRSLYTFLKRTAPPPFMSSFDAPNREQFCPRRERSNTPLQALQLMNDVQHFESARALAERLLMQGGATARDRITYGYRTVLARSPETDELDVLEKTVSLYLTRYGRDQAAAAAVIHAGESRPPKTLNVPELAAYTLVVNLLLNLDETLTRN